MERTPRTPRATRAPGRPPRPERGEPSQAPDPSGVGRLSRVPTVCARPCRMPLGSPSVSHPSARGTPQTAISWYHSTREPTGCGVTRSSMEPRMTVPCFRIRARPAESPDGRTSPSTTIGSSKPSGPSPVRATKADPEPSSAAGTLPLVIRVNGIRRSCSRRSSTRFHASSARRGVSIRTWKCAMSGPYDGPQA